jgi:hypothetical protein
MNNKIYYKVVTQDLKSFLSHRLSYGSYKQKHIFDRDFAVQYKIGEFVYPVFEKSKLYVFNSLFFAHQFGFTTSGEYKIYSCEVINPSPHSLVCDWSYVSQFHDFWKNEDRIYKGISPYATVMCDTVKLCVKLHN